MWPADLWIGNWDVDKSDDWCCKNVQMNDFDSQMPAVFEETTLMPGCLSQIGQHWVGDDPQMARRNISSHLMMCWNCCLIWGRVSGETTLDLFVHPQLEIHVPSYSVRLFYFGYWRVKFRPDAQKWGQMNWDESWSHFLWKAPHLKKVAKLQRWPCAFLFCFFFSWYPCCQLSPTVGSNWQTI